MRSLRESSVSHHLVTLSLREIGTSSQNIHPEPSLSCLPLPFPQRCGQAQGHPPDAATDPSLHICELSTRLSSVNYSGSGYAQQQKAQEDIYLGLLHFDAENGVKM